MAGTTLFLHDFTVLDFAYLCPRLGMVGDSYYVSVELTGQLDERDFLLDFGPAKKILKALVDEKLDHKLLVPTKAVGLEVGAGLLTFRTAAGESYRYQSPEQALAFLPGAEISASAIEQELALLATQVLPKNVESARFHLRTEPRFEREANFRYTHGLRFHEGNCQRLFHGHRNPIEVWVHGARSADWENWLAEEWGNAHFVPRATLKNLAELDLPLATRRKHHKGIAEISFSAAQGEFWAAMPAAQIVVTDVEPSIETISRLALVRLKQEGLKGEVRVVAYEGLNKGAASSATL